MFERFKKKKTPDKEAAFPPIPDWRPDIPVPLEKIIDRVRYYTNSKSDFAVFTHGTIAILSEGLSDTEAETHAKTALHDVFYAHPDMTPLNMDDGNVVASYHHNVMNVVLDEVVQANWAEIDAQHLRALATHEVLITPDGPNQFDALGKKALFGRCYMFMDAQSPQLVRIVRAGKES